MTELSGSSRVICWRDTPNNSKCVKNSAHTLRSVISPKWSSQAKYQIKSINSARGKADDKGVSGGLV